MKFDEYLKMEAAKKVRRSLREEEHDLQCECVNWFRNVYPDYGQLLFAVPNGGYRSPKTAAKLKAEGVTAGVSDLMLLVPAGGCHGLCIEMKTRKGYLRGSQKQFQLAVTQMGYRYEVVRSLQDFRGLIEGYIGKAR